MSPSTLLDILDSIESHPRPDLLHVKEEGGYRELSSADVVSRIHRLAGFLLARGVQIGDRVALLSENRPEWTVSDFAIQSVGAVNVPIYTTLSRAQIGHLLKDSGCMVALVSRASLRDNILAAAPGSDLRCVVVFDGSAPGSEIEHLTLEEALRQGEAHLRAGTGLLETRRSAVRPDHLASIIYTSGTTGEPKGVMLTHGNFCSNIDTCLRLIPFSRSDLALSFLPLSHVFERTVEYCYLGAGGSIAYAESIETVAANIVEVRPTVLSAVPRVLEKIHGRILERVSSSPALRRRIFAWAMAAGRRRLERQLAGRDEPLAERVRLALAERLVFRKIKDSLGGRVRFLVSGGAPLRPEIAEFMLSTGIVVLEGYGLTETSPVIALNTFEHLRPGTVGRVIPDVEVRIAEDGEILVRGPNIMQGYFGKPEATREVLQDGWFATGDVGRLDEDGFLTITDRKKDILITSGGKNVAPQPIESSLKASPYIANAMLVGDRRPFISALIVPDFDVLDKVAESRGWKSRTPAQMIESPELRALIDDEIQRANDRLSPYERIKRFALLDRDFAAEAGEITPTMKVKRRVVLERYGLKIESLYQS